MIHRPINVRRIQRYIDAVRRITSSNHLDDQLSAFRVQLCTIKADNPLLQEGSAVLSNEDGQRIIYLSESVPYYMRSFLITHEFGHLLMHESESRFYAYHAPKSRIEYEADLFAFLLLDHEIDPWDYMDYTNEQIARNEGVSVRIVDYIMDVTKGGRRPLC